jgi:hypothetical protein
VLIDPGAEHRKIKKKPKQKSKRHQQDAQSGNQQQVFEERIGFPDKISHGKRSVIAL